MSRSISSSFITRSSRELGVKPLSGDYTKLQRSLASSIKVHHIWDPRTTVRDSDHGGVFNFDFSKNGSLLGVACERKSVLLFDPFNGQMVAAKANAHADCVNCVKFLDDRLFATCSDDTNVALWDARYLKHHVQVFRGHSNWVKNIEYDSNQGMLLTSGFDGCIYTWNINRYSNEESSNKVFSTSGLMRSKLSPDFTKLLISTHEGYIIVVHNLDLTTIGEDLKGFKPNMYHLMQRSQTPLRIGLMYNHVFEQERNRVEFINDWPSGNDANIVSSIQVHPQGWCVLSRNTDSTEKAEWTCIHDIQDYTSEKKPVPHPWELESVTPHTSAAHSSSTNTPAFSSVAPSHLRGTAQVNNDRIQNNASRQPRSSSTSYNRQDTRNSPERVAHHSSTASAAPVSDQQATEAPGNQHQQQASDSGQVAVEDGMDNIYVRPEPPSGNIQVHNSLIQIRRGARNSDGQFSFSVSVHTASGRTIEFNQEDLDSADDEEFVVEQILSNSRRSSSRTVTIIRQQEQNNGSSNSEEASGRIAETDRNSSDHGESDTDEDENHEVENVYENHLDDSDDEEEEEDDDDGESESADNIDSIGQGTENNEETGSNADESGSVVLNVNIGVDNLLDNTVDHNVGQDASDDEDIDDDDDDDVFIPSEEDLSDDAGDVEEQSANRSRSRDFFNEQLLRSAMGSHSPDLLMDAFSSHSPNEDIHNTRRNSLSRTVNADRGTDAISGNDDRSPENPRVNVDAQINEQSSSDTPSSSQVPLFNSAISQPRTNTFMFVLQSNSRDRRRILNLSYMDSYTERENSVLQKKIHSNKKRLLGYMEECNVGRGFIKEVAFSADGRLISSPFGFGLRIFSFDSDCNELCDCIPTSPVKLYEVTCSLAHVNCVVATKFSPTHNMVVSGCLDGKIAFHQPVL